MRPRIFFLSLFFLAKPSAAFQRDLSPEGVAPAFRAPPAWPRLLAGVPGVPRNEADEALHLAARGWTDVPGAWFFLEGSDDGLRPWIRVEVYEKGWPHDPTFVAHTERTYVSPPGTISSATIRLNAEHHRFCHTRCQEGAVPLRAALLHEMGHALGLAHSGVRGAVMAPGLGKDPRATAPIELSEDDRKGLIAIYGGPRPAVPEAAAPVAPPVRNTTWLAAAGVLGLGAALGAAQRRSSSN